MIIDILNHLGKYVALNPLFAEVVRFIETHDLRILEPGRYPILDERIYLNIEIAKGRDKAMAVLETHVRMIDIQIPLSCEETYGYTPLCDLPEADYNAEKDYSKYEGMAQTYVTLKPGQMAIFFPQDGHAPCIAEQPEIKKAIFKVKMV